jgi:hypothetical protein
VSTNLWLSVAISGLLINRPTAPDVPSGMVAFYFATDNNALYAYLGSAWVDISALGGVTNTGVIASTTQTRAGATQLTGTYNNVTTVANASDAVGLPPITFIGQQVTVTNAGANAMLVFPTSAAAGASTTIDGGSAGASKTCTNAKSALFTATTLTNWQSIGSAARVA